MATIGVRKPYYAKYSASGNVVTYSDGGLLAKAIDFSAEIDSGEDNNLYADDGIAESDRSFKGGKISITTDDMTTEASAAILGIIGKSVTAGSETVTELVFDDAMASPEMGFGIIVRKKKSGVIKYRAIVFPRIKFSIPKDAAKTTGETIEWQTPELEASIMRDDTATRMWKREATFATEAAAETYIKQTLGITAQAAGVTSSVASGTYTTAQSVVLTTTEASGTIRYTTNGTIPTATNGTTYSAPIACAKPSNTCIKAICTASGKAASSITELYVEVTA